MVIVYPATIMFFSTLCTLDSAIIGAAAYQISGTPNDSFSSSAGVLGCHNDTNRVSLRDSSVDDPQRINIVPLGSG